MLLWCPRATKLPKMTYISPNAYHTSSREFEKSIVSDGFCRSLYCYNSKLNAVYRFAVDVTSGENNEPGGFQGSRTRITCFVCSGADSMRIYPASGETFRVNLTV